MSAYLKPVFFFIWIDGLDAHSFGTLLHVDLDFLRERLRLLARARLHANRRGNLHVAPRLPVDAHFSKLVLHAHRLSRTQRHRFLKIFRHFFLAAICSHRRSLRRKTHRAQQSRYRGATPCSFARTPTGLIHYFLASNISSSVRCFSWYIASNWYRSCAFDGFNPACARKSAIALSSTSSFS